VGVDVAVAVAVAVATEMTGREKNVENVRNICFVSVVNVDFGGILSNFGVIWWFVGVFWGAI